MIPTDANRPNGTLATVRGLNYFRPALEKFILFSSKNTYFALVNAAPNSKRSPRALHGEHITSLNINFNNARRTGDCRSSIAKGLTRRPCRRRLLWMVSVRDESSPGHAWCYVGSICEALKGRRSPLAWQSHLPNGASFREEISPSQF